MNENKIKVDKNTFIKFKNDNQIKINDKMISKDLLIYLFTTKGIGLYNLIDNMFKSENEKLIITYDKEKSYEKIEEITSSRTDIYLGIKELSKEKEYKEKGNDFLKTYELYCNEEAFLEKYKNIFFSVDIEGIKYKFSFEKIWEFLTLPEDKYQKLLYGETIEGMKKEYFIYGCVMFLKQKKIINDYILQDNIKNRYEDLKTSKIVDIEAINEITETDNPYIDKIQLNQELEHAVLKDIPTKLTELEQAIFIYIKLCKILTYDDEYFAQGHNNINTRQQNDINYISSVTPKNPQVVCYVFNEIYAKLLSNIGIHHELNGNIFGKYGREHENLIFKSGKFLVIADSTDSILKGDLAYIKLNEKIIGLACINSNEQTKKEFNETLNKVYNYINIQEKQEKGKDIQDYLKEYHQLKEKTPKKNISMEEKLKILIEIVKKMQLKEMDQISCIKYLTEKMFLEEEKNNLKLSFVSDIFTTNGNKYAMTDVIFMIKDENITKYYLYKTDGELEEEKPERLEHYFKYGYMKYINSEYKIPGIEGYEFENKKGGRRQ